MFFTDEIFRINLVNLVQGILKKREVVIKFYNSPGSVLPILYLYICTITNSSGKVDLN